MVKKINNNSKRLLLFFSIIIIYLLAWPISVDPVSWESPRDTRKDPIFSINQKLSGIEIFWEDDGYLGPEDIVLNDGKIYVGYENGVIKNTDEIFSNTKGRPLGMACLLYTSDAADE